LFVGTYSKSQLNARFQHKVRESDKQKPINARLINEQINV
jgi:hypothetical protein